MDGVTEDDGSQIVGPDDLAPEVSEPPPRAPLAAAECPQLDGGSDSAHALENSLFHLTLDIVMCMNGHQEIDLPRSGDNEVSLSNYSSEELLAELARRLHTASEELKLLRRLPRTDSQSFDQSPARDLPETAEGLLAIINVDPRTERASSAWDSQDPYTSVKVLRKKAIVKLARVWTRMALDPSKLRNGEINRRRLERETGIARNTMRPYLDAGLALHKAGRLYLDSDPSELDIRIVDKSMDEGERGRMRESKSKVKSDF